MNRTHHGFDLDTIEGCHKYIESLEWQIKRLQSVAAVIVGDEVTIDWDNNQGEEKVLTAVMLTVASVSDHAPLSKPEAG